MRMIEAHNLTNMLMSDDLDNMPESVYEHSESKTDLISIEKVGKKVEVFHLVPGSGSGITKIGEYQWRGTKDFMTITFRDWLHMTVNNFMGTYVK